LVCDLHQPPHSAGSVDNTNRLILINIRVPNPAYCPGIYIPDHTLGEIMLLHK
jgi:hypothetical protein